MVPRRGKMIKTGGVELLEGNIADVQDSYDHEEAAQRSAKYLLRGEAGP